MVHSPSGNCMEISDDHKEVYMDKCDGSASQVWEWTHHYTPHREVKNWF